jgi:hypothetical protein
MERDLLIDCEHSSVGMTAEHVSLESPLQIREYLIATVLNGEESASGILRAAFLGERLFRVDGRAR